MQPQGTSFSLSISHIAVYVVDLEISTHFYKEVMQLEMIPEPFRDGLHTWFHLGGGCQLHLIGGGREKARHNINNHLAFTTGHIEAFIQKLQQHGYSYGDAAGNKGKIHIRPDGIQQVFFQDPDGYWLEVNNDVQQ